MNGELKRNPKGKFLKFEILGEPKSKQSMRTAVAMRNGEPISKFTKSGKKSFKLHQYQDKKTESNELWVKWNIAAQLPFGHKLFTGPIIIHKLHYIFYPTKPLIKKVELSMMKYYKTTKPDVPDNLNKMIFDAMEKLVYQNDSQVIGIDNLRKYYGLQPKIIIELEEL